MIILDGLTLAQKILNQLKTEVAKLPSAPQLNIILVGNDPASLQYVTMKTRKAESIGIKVVIHHLALATTSQVIDLIQTLNSNPEITGLMVQLPLPSVVDTRLVLAAINPAKDVDGLTPTNLGLLFHHHSQAIVSATPLAVINLLSEYQISLQSKDVVIIGRSPYIGLPLVALTLHQNASVTVCHSFTPNLAAATSMADIVISAVGKPKLITANMIKTNAIVIDIGLSPDPQTGKLVGDVDFESVAPKCSYITPVPGGVGPMTIACLLKNLIQTALTSK